MKRSARQKADLCLTLGLGAGFLAAGIYALFLPWQAAVLPVLLTLAGLGHAVALIRALLIAEPGEDKPVLGREDAASFLWFLSATAAVTAFGFEIGGAVFALAFFRWSAGFRWLQAAALAIPVPLAAWLAFDILLGRPGFDGLVLGAF